MKKSKKKETTSIENKSNLKKFLLDISNIDLISCLIVVTILFFPTLTRGWLFYDERTIYEGTYFPAPKSFLELFEIIENFGLNFNLISSNPFYSSNYVTRTSPLGQLLGMLLGFAFKQQAFFYHLLNLFLHLINTTLIFFILKIAHPSRFFVIVLTLIWAIHPVNLEPVLLATNFGALFSYMFFFGFFLDFLLNRKNNTTSFIRSILIPLFFLVPMMTNEYIITLPFVLFIISFYHNKQENPLNKALKISLKETKPYFYGLLVYILYFMFFTSYKISQQALHNHPIVFFERVFWLAPQIFFHLFKLIVFPLKLSIDQTLFVKLGNSLFDPYALFCILFLFIWLTVPLYLFAFKNKLANTFLLSWTFFFALFPFLHILMPSYTLAAERYLYAPLALLVFGLAKWTNVIASSLRMTVPVLLSITLVLCLIRSHLRTNVWKNNESFINSTYKASKDPLFKAVRLGMLGKVTSIDEPQRINEIRSYFIKTLHYLKVARKETYIKKKKYQKNIPEVIKAYGLDFDSLLTKIAFLEASSICLDLKGDHKVGLKILEPYTKNPQKLDPAIAELYSHLLIKDKEYKKAENVLLQVNKTYPNNSLILNNLFDLYAVHLKDYIKAQEYLQEALKLYLFDPNVLLKAVSFYQEIKNPPLVAQYAYLHGLRTGSKLTYQIALSNYLNTDYPRGAKLALDKLLKIDSNDPETLYFASKYYYQLNDHQKALTYLTEAYKQTQKTGINTKLAFDISHNLAKLYLFLGEKDTAINLALDNFDLAKDKESLKKLAGFYKNLGLNKHVQLCLNKIRSLKG